MHLRILLPGAVRLVILQICIVFIFIYHRFFGLDVGILRFGFFFYKQVVKINPCFFCFIHTDKSQFQITYIGKRKIVVFKFSLNYFAVNRNPIPIFSHFRKINPGRRLHGESYFFAYGFVRGIKGNYHAFFRLTAKLYIERNNRFLQIQRTRSGSSNVKDCRTGEFILLNGNFLRIITLYAMNKRIFRKSTARSIRR